MNSKVNYHFRNWAGNSTCISKKFFQPETEEELAKVISGNKKIGLIGSGHSWSPLCTNDDTLINLDFYNKVLFFDRENKKIRVQAGIKLWQLNEFLDREGFALSNLGSISKQSVAGAISTGTHGTGINFGILASQVEEFTLIKANGEKLILNRNDDIGLFNLAIINLGCLGVISEITLLIVPSFRLKEQSFVMPFTEAIEKLDEFVSGSDHFKIWWFPHIEECVVFRYDRTNEKANDSKFRQWLLDKFISVWIYRFLLIIGNINNGWRRNINYLLVNMLISPIKRIEKSFKVFNVAAPPIHRETDWAFDYNKGKEVLREFKKMIESSKHQINFLQEVRFSKGDDFALSPAYQRNTIWLGCYYAGNKGWEELLLDFENFAKNMVAGHTGERNFILTGNTC